VTGTIFAVPTYRRHSNGEAQTFEHAPRDFPLHVFCRSAEADQYEAMLERLGRREDTFVPIPDGAVSGIATTRQWMVDWARTQGASRLVMIDDDLHFIVRGLVPQTEPGWDYKLRPCEPQHFRNLAEKLEEKLSDYAHVGVSMREGNNRLPGIGNYALATRAIRLVGYRLDVLGSADGALTGSVFRPEVEGREDLDMTLQLLRRGYPNWVTYHWAQGQRSAEAPGGLEGVRDDAQLTSSAERLAALHPGLVRLRQKYNKSGGMAGWRTEVTISWKDALAEGEATRRAA